METNLRYIVHVVGLGTMAWLSGCTGEPSFSDSGPLEEHSPSGGTAGGAAGQQDACDASRPSEDSAEFRLVVANYDEPVASEEAENCVRALTAPASGRCEVPRRNQLGQCAPTSFCDEVKTENGTLIGTGALCRTYEEGDAFRTGGASLRLDFDVSGDPVTTGDGSAAPPFAGHSERLGGRAPQCRAATVTEPLDVSSFREGYLTFWIRRSSYDVEMEVSLKSDDGFESFGNANKPVLSDFLAPEKTCGGWRDWVKICMPLDFLVPARKGTESGRVNIARLQELNFAFVPKGVTTGSVWIDEVEFEARACLLPRG